MPTEIIWVPKPDGKTWNSSRTRDLVDLAFTIERKSDDHTMIMIRCSKNSDENGRARTVIGRVYTKSVLAARELVKQVVSEANTKPNQEEARSWLLNQMLGFSLDLSPEGRPLNPEIIKDGAWVTKNTLGMVVASETPVAEEEFDVAAHVESLPLEIDLSKPVTETPSSGIYKVDPTTESWISWGDIADDLSKSIAAKRAAIAMKETVEAVMETATPVAEPVAEVVSTEAPQFITINGKQIPIAYPK